MTAVVLFMPVSVIACVAVMAVVTVHMDIAMLVMMMKSRRHAYISGT